MGTGNTRPLLDSFNPTTSPASQISYWMQMSPQMNLVQLVAKYIKVRTKMESDGLILKIGPLLRICWTAEHCEVRDNREKWRRFRTGKYQVHDSLGLMNILDHGRFTRTHSLHEDLGPHICIKNQLKLAFCLVVIDAFFELQKLKKI